MYTNVLVLYLCRYVYSSSLSKVSKRYGGWISIISMLQPATSDKTRSTRSRPVARGVGVTYRSMEFIYIEDLSYRSCSIRLGNYIFLFCKALHI